ncbi:MAG: hypothetical protein ACKVHE_14910 [Planctomycetales bacterium]|jgi:hypothetical protein
MTTLVWVYAAYLSVCLCVTVWVGRTLQRNAPVFLQNGTEEGKEYADSLVHLLTVGFYLINVGAIALALKYGDPVKDFTEAVELLSTKVGVILLILGLVHTVILAKLTVIRRNMDFDLPHRATVPAAGRETDMGPAR